MLAALSTLLDEARNLIVVIAFVWVGVEGLRFSFARLKEREIGVFVRLGLLLVLVAAYVLRQIPEPFTADIRPSVEQALFAGRAGHLYSPLWDMVLSTWFTIVESPSPANIALLNALLGGLGVLLGFVFVWTFTRKAGAALLAAALLASSSLLVHFGASDCPYLLLVDLLLLGLAGFSWWLRDTEDERSRARAWALGALAVALCGVVRVEAIVYLFFPGATLLLPRFRPVFPNLRRVVLPALAAGIIAVMPLWAAYQHAFLQKDHMTWTHALPFFSWQRLALVDNGFAGAAFPFLVLLGMSLLAARTARGVHPLRWALCLVLIFLVGPLAALLVGPVHLTEAGSAGRFSWRRLRWRPDRGGAGLWLGVGAIVVLVPAWSAGPANFCSARYYLPYVAVALALVALSLAGVRRAPEPERSGSARQGTALWLPLIALLAGAQLSSFGHLDRKWTFSEEYRFLSEVVPTVPPGCVIVSRALRERPSQVEAGLFHGRHISAMFAPGRSHEWRSVKQHLSWFQEAGPGERERCAYYVESAGCWALRGDEAAEAPVASAPGKALATPADIPAVRTSCRAIRENFDLDLVTERPLDAVGAFHESYVARKLPVGLYRLRPKN